ncbi:TPA: DUF2290 domain-containing protein [Clostridioides difficile]|nr:DUF2290 domain-containing protein [Clostridioides difficile]
MYNEIKKDIRDTISKYLKKGIIIQPNFSEKHCTQDSIQSTHSLTGIFKDLPYYKIFNQLYDERNYICCLEDGSFFQVGYWFKSVNKKKKFINKAVLSFYPNLEDYEDDLFLNKFKNYIRIEFSINDSDHTVIKHPKGHIHIGLYNEFRIGISRIPKFSEFVNFVLYLNYQDVWSTLFDGELNKLIKDIERLNKNKKTYTEEECLLQEEKEYISITI